MLLRCQHQYVGQPQGSERNIVKICCDQKPLPIVVRLLFIKHFMSPPDLYIFRMFCRHGQIHFCKDIFMLPTSFSGNVFVLRSSYVKNSTRRWVTLSQSVRRETNFSKNRIWPQPTRYVFILEISAKKSQSTFYLKFV